MRERLRGRLQSLLGKERGVRALILLGAVGIALIALSELLPQRGGAEHGTTAAQPIALPAAQVEQALEERLADLLCGVEGVGECRAMVTLERGVQTVYATDRSTTSGAASAASESVLTLTTEEGEVGLTVAELQPTVRGVAIVCEGGGDPTVCDRVVQLVSAALGLSERRICVAGGR